MMRSLLGKVAGWQASLSLSTAAMIVSSAATVLLLAWAARLISGAVAPSAGSFARFVALLCICLGARAFTSVTINRVWLQRLHE